MGHWAYPRHIRCPAKGLGLQGTPVSPRAPLRKTAPSASHAPRATPGGQPSGRACPAAPSPPPLPTSGNRTPARSPTITTRRASDRRRRPTRAGERPRARQGANRMSAAGVAPGESITSRPRDRAVNRNACSPPACIAMAATVRCEPCAFSKRGRRLNCGHVLSCHSLSRRCHSQRQHRPARFLAGSVAQGPHPRELPGRLQRAVTAVCVYRASWGFSPVMLTVVFAQLRTGDAGGAHWCSALFPTTAAAARSC